MRALIVAGHADPQEAGFLQSEQYELSARACCLLARAFAEAGYDVALEDAFTRPAFELCWRSGLAVVEWQIVVVLPVVEEVLRLSRSRGKDVPERLLREQHAGCLLWPEPYRMDPTGLTVNESLQLIERIVGRS